jgi:hypothetical protein
MLAQKIAGTYCAVSNNYILPPHSYLGRMLMDIRDEKGNLIPGEVAKAQKQLATQAQNSNQGVSLDALIQLNK